MALQTDLETWNSDEPSPDQIAVSGRSPSYTDLAEQEKSAPDYDDWLKGEPTLVTLLSIQDQFLKGDVTKLSVITLEKVVWKLRKPVSEEGNSLFESRCYVCYGESHKHDIESLCTRTNARTSEARYKFSLCLEMNCYMRRLNELDERDRLREENKNKTEFSQFMAESNLDYQDEIKDLQEEIRSLLDKVECLEASRAEAEENWQKQIEILEESNKDLKNGLSLANSDYFALVKNKEEMLTERQGLNEQIFHLASIKDSHETHINSLKSEIDALNSTNANITKEKEEQAAVLKEKIESLNKDMETNMQAHGVSAAVMKEKELSEQALNAKLDKINSIVKQKEEKLQELSSKLRTSQTRREGDQKKIKEVEASITAAQAEISKLKEQAENDKRLIKEKEMMILMNTNETNAAITDFEHRLKTEKEGNVKAIAELDKQLTRPTPISRVLNVIISIISSLETHQFKFKP